MLIYDYLPDPQTKAPISQSMESILSEPQLLEYVQQSYAYYFSQLGEERTIDLGQARQILLETLVEMDKRGYWSFKDHQSLRDAITMQNQTLRDFILNLFDKNRY